MYVCVWCVHAVCGIHVCAMSVWQCSVYVCAMHAYVCDMHVLHV